MKIPNEYKLIFFRELYETAKADMQSELENMTKYFEQYKGSAEIDCEYGPAEKAKYVRNITYELIESQVSGYIPTPAVSPRMWSEKYERNAKSVETMLKNTRDRLPFEENNDIDERYSPIYGGSVWLVEWDESIVSAKSVGDVNITCIPPNRFVGQPKIYNNIQDSEYCFISFETTKEDLIRRYDVDESVLDSTFTEEGDNDETATVYVCYYKNEDGDVCEYVWSGDAELRHIEDYYSRKKYICKICGKRKGLCKCEEEGKKPKFEIENDEYEELDYDVSLSDGSLLLAECVKFENGKPVTEKKTVDELSRDGSVEMTNIAGLMLPKAQTIDIPVKEKTRIPWYKPNMLPIVIRKNTSAENKLFGQSDCEFIRYQQQAINKIESRIMDKLLRSGVFPVLPEDATMDLNNSILETALRCSQSNYMMFNKLDLTPDISRDVAMADRIYDQAKRILGISDSFQGQRDNSAQSGIAKQLQIQQSAGRLASKRQLKNAAYASMDKIIFQLMLAYADEPRPATYIDAYGRQQNCEFNRYDFVERDDAGNWYYNDEYLFSADASADEEKDRAFLWQEARLNFQSGAYGNPQNPQTLLIFWLNMEKAHYPNAHDNVVRIQEEIRQQQEAMALAQQAQMAQQENVALREELDNRKGYEGYLQDKLVRGADANV